MSITSAIEKLAQEWEERARVLRQRRYVEDALRIEDMVNEMRAAARAGDEDLLTPVEAEAFTRGYDSDYLRRTIENRGTRFKPLYRKGDLPRHPVRSERAERERMKRQQKGEGAA